MIDYIKTNDEFIEWSSTRINRKLPLTTTTKDLYQALELLSFKINMLTKE